MSELSPQTIETVKATIPFLAENATRLTEHFYKRMFTANPEVKEFFNVSNQASGVQQRALGGAICAFAQNIETPENLATAISRIANKHASLGVKPEHYPIVGKHLLGSIDDLLDPAPKEVLSAWEEAYGFLASVLINAEDSLYTEQQEQTHGWTGFRKMEVFEITQESKTITSFYLRPKDGGKLPSFKAGQYTTLRVPLPDGTTTMRNYSLSGSPQWDHYRLSVKREIALHADTPEGYVSNYLHAQVTTGSDLEIGPPCGDFFLQEHSPEEPILLLSGGVGLTPLLSMLHAAGNRPLTFLHGAINGESHALRDEVLKLSEPHPNVTVHFRYSSPNPSDEEQNLHHSTGLFSPEFLAEFITPETQIYFCGPKPMMQHVYQALRTLNHPAENTHYEFFGPQQDLES